MLSLTHGGLFPHGFFNFELSASYFGDVYLESPKRATWKVYSFRGQWLLFSTQGLCQFDNFKFSAWSFLDCVGSVLLVCFPRLPIPPHYFKCGNQCTRGRLLYVNKVI